MPDGRLVARGQVGGAVASGWLACAFCIWRLHASDPGGDVGRAGQRLALRLQPRKR